MDFPPRFLEKVCNLCSLFSTCIIFRFIAPSIFPEKDFSRIFRDVNGYGHVFFDRIRKCNWYELVYDNSNEDAFYYPDIVKLFYLGIDTNIINLHQNQFMVHLEHGTS